MVVNLNTNKINLNFFYSHLNRFLPLIIAFKVVKLGGGRPGGGAAGAGAPPAGGGGRWGVGCGF